jgi:hypothetical protein
LFYTYFLNAGDGYCLADSGREHIVFLNASAPFTLKLEGLAGPLKAEWHQSFIGHARTRGA